MSHIIKLLRVKKNKFIISTHRYYLSDFIVNIKIRFTNYVPHEKIRAVAGPTIFYKRYRYHSE